MSHFIVFLGATFTSVLPLLIDSMVKGTALLLLAGACTLALRSASAATRHLVWMVAVAALLVMPILSFVLPQWRILPRWAALGKSLVAAKSASPGPIGVRSNRHPDAPDSTAMPDADVPGPTVAPAPSSPTLRAFPPWASSLSSEPSPSERTALLPALAAAWAGGCVLLLGRLGIGHWMLRRATRDSQAVTNGPLAIALAEAARQIALRKPVRLMIHEQRTIPVVWGVFRPRLLLPAESRKWSDAQLRSVLLHELAHIKRRDTLVQWFTQVACAVHWLNPLVWLAAWRLHAEGERACDDLVLASGVKASAYAGHLLHVATRLTPAHWTAACGLAMARKSSLESRLLAVLNERLNRRSVTTVLTAVAMLLGAAIAIPIAMLRAADEKRNPPQERGQAVQPQHEYARSLFGKWRANARTDGKIPGALIGQLASEVDGFIKQYPDDEKTPKLAALRPRLDATRDWAEGDAVTLLDDIAAISPAPVSWADLSMEFSAMSAIHPGTPLPVELTSAAWGPPAANGLRAAWLLEPRAEQYPLGSVLKARVLFHNSGSEPVVFRTETWHQHDRHIARDVKGGEIKISGTWYTGVTPMTAFRLAPGEYAEVRGHGIAIGAGQYEEEYSAGRLGAVIEAKEGDEVRFSSTVDASHGGWSRPDDPKDPAELWKKTARERVEREAPVPRAAAAREQLIRRATLDLFGEPPTAEETAAFRFDEAPDALARLVERLLAKKRIEPFVGTLPTGETRFRVIAANPDAAKEPSTANGPGRYVLGDQVRLLVSQTASDSQRTNKATIAFLSPDPKVASPHQPYEIALPDGSGTYAFVWERSAGVLWLMQKDVVRKYDFTNPAQVKETRITPGSIMNIPGNLHEALRKVFDVPGAPGKQPESGSGSR